MDRLPIGVDITFEKDLKYFWLKCPYNKSFIWALGINGIAREWANDKKAYRIGTTYYEDTLELVEQFFSKWKRVPILRFMEEHC